MKKETLKPCPFCGQEHTTITESNTEGIRIRSLYGATKMVF